MFNLSKILNVTMHILLLCGVMVTISLLIFLMFIILNVVLGSFLCMAILALYIHYWNVLYFKYEKTTFIKTVVYILKNKHS
jgi:hypothetical protein